MALPCVAWGDSGCPTGMQAYWHLDEGAGSVAVDDSFGANHAVCAGACPQTVSGEIFNAKQFDGSSTGLSALGDSFNWNSGTSFSVEFWMKKTGCTSSNEVIVGRNGASLHWWVGVSCPNGGAAQFALIDNAGNFSTAIGTRNLADGKWHHVAAISDAAAKKLLIYVDGALEAQTATAYTAGFAATNTTLDIGWLNLDEGYHYSGVLDEVGIYDRSLTETEIRSHYYLARSYCPDCSAPVKIMPVGDSITRGMNSGTSPDTSDYWISYRRQLWSQLTGAGYSIDFVGSVQDGSAYPDFDHDNEGHGGYAASQVADEIGGWLASQPPDVILLHIGTNGYQVSSDVSRILDRIFAFNKDITVVLAKIINRATSASSSEIASTTRFNNEVAAMAQTRIANGDKIIIVDQENGAGINYALYPAGDMWTDLHPYATGYTKMAGVWFDALKTFLQPCGPVAPRITSTPVTSIFVNQAYAYQVAAVGSPSPTFALVTYPTGMTINSTTGQISWTPTSTGTYAVGVTAANSSGTTTQDFEIIVDQAPDCIDGTISYWKLDEQQGTVYDDFFGTHDGSCYGQCPSAAVGLVNGAQVFNATNTGINVPADSAFDWAAGGSFTIEYWMKKSTRCTGNQVILGRNSEESGNSLHWWTGCWDNGGNDTASFVLIAKNGDGSTGEGFLRGTIRVNDGQWHHIAAVRDGTNRENLLYVDGTLDAFAQGISFRDGFSAPATALNLGWLNLSDGYHFNGTLDEMAVYGKALSAVDIQNHYIDGFSGLSYCEAATKPVITRQPSSVTVTQGQTATFTVTATGTAPLSYKWQKNGTDISGATSASYTTPATTASDSGATFRCAVTNTAGSAVSSSATLTVLGGAPTITTQPAGQTVQAGQRATFTVAATGTAPLSYRWQKNGVNISRSTSASYTTPVTRAGDDGATFRCVVTNSAGSTVSDSATLTVVSAPAITVQPSSQTVRQGQTATFSVTATGTAPLSYQWQKNGVNIAGAVSASYTTPATSRSDNGARFRCIVTNTIGTATSNSATLRVR
jgi:PKD repeat protein